MVDCLAGDAYSWKTTMLVGYVSDENYAALSNVDFVFEAA